MYRRFGKRLFDLLVAVPLFLVSLPLLALISLAIGITLGRPVFFVQERPGLHGRLFRLVKFRTMREARDRGGELLSDDLRMTRLGRFLRATSLDELPELVQVITGQLSLVGPRPLLQEYLPLYSAEQRRRHEPRPGITGWAQVHGRNELPWDARLAMDVWYVDHVSFGLDLRIILRTVGKVLRMEGIHAPGRATVERFRGDGPRASG
jgi:lipopolysaccharide/colanic/teichoic acid biosynthesis glycosyltransferase